MAREKKYEMLAQTEPTHTIVWARAMPAFDVGGILGD